MEKIDIQHRMRMVKNLADFAKLLNDVKIDKFNSSKYKITEKQLLHFCNSKTIPDRYRTFHIRKKSGGLREINAPCYQLGILLDMLNIVFKAIYTPGESAMGFTEERSVVTNACMHIGHHYVFNIDLENFFPSIPQARVWARIQLPPFNFPRDVANVVAGLCCHVNGDGTANVLPQGAATSPLLTNAICDTLDRRMRGVAKRFGLHYSRYADDMTFSSMHNTYNGKPIYDEGSEFRIEIKRVIEGQGFKMNDKKTRLQRDGERQEVTGLTVNQRANVTRKYVRDLRWMLHCWEKDGYGKAYALFYNYYKRTKGYIKKGEPVMENVIDGKLNYMRMVKGAKDSTYLKLLARYNNLKGLVFEDTETDKERSYIYVYSYPTTEFQKLFGTSVQLEVSPKNKLIGRCTIDEREKVLAISKSTQVHLCKDIAILRPGEKVESNLLDQCFVTLCRDKGKNFWLITKSEMKRSKCLSLLNANVDIDLLLDTWEEHGIEEAAHLFAAAIGQGDIHAETMNHPMDVAQKGAIKNPAKDLQCSQCITNDDIEELGDWEDVNLGDISDAEELGTL